MSKKKKIALTKYLGLGILVVGLLATVCMFLPSLKMADSDEAYSGTLVIFGGTIVNGSIFGFSVGSAVINFSFLGCLAYFLPLIGGIIMAIAKQKEKLLKLIGLLVFVASVVLLFLVPTFTSITYTLLGSSTVSTPDWQMNYGLIIAAVLAILGTLGSVYSLLKSL